MTDNERPVLEILHTVIGTAANANVYDITQGHALLHGEEEIVFADSGYQDAEKRPEVMGVNWPVAMCPGKCRTLDKAEKLNSR